MDEPAWAWPYWKFGLKRDDLFSKLHDQYNTFPSSIQDPEAFHHDVSEIAHDAATADEFHGRLAQRKAQRLAELNDTLESAALEIIANPALVGTEQWQYALQLFRTKSLDSLVRYFASYLPEDHKWHRQSDNHGDSATVISLESSSISVVDSIPLSCSSASSIYSTTSTSDASAARSAIFDDDEHIPLTHEPLSIISCFTESHPHLPPSPRSLTMCSDDSSSSADAAIHRAYVVNTLTPARTLSFSESDSDRFLDLQHPLENEEDEDDLAEDDAVFYDSTSPSASVSNLSEASSFALLQKKKGIVEAAAPSPIPESESEEAPTPKPVTHHIAESFFDSKPPSPAPAPANTLRDRDRSISPNSTMARPRHPLSQVHTPHHPHHSLHHNDGVSLLPPVSLPIAAVHRTASQPQRGASAASTRRRRRSPSGIGSVASMSRVHKSVSDATTRSRPRGRRPAEQ